MSLGWIEGRYGFGAGRVPLRPVQRRQRDVPSIREGWAEAVRDGDTPGSSVVEVLRLSPAFVAVAVVLTFLFATVLRLPPDESEITIVAFAEPPIEEVLPEPPPPEVPVVPEELPPPPPEPEPAPVERAAPRPPPPPPVPVRVEPPPRPAPPPPPTQPPPPRVQIQQVARAQPPPRPSAPRRVTRDTRAQPELAPRLRFDALAAPDPAKPPPPDRPTRAPRFSAARPPDAMPRLDAPALRATPAAPAPRLRNDRRSRPTPDRSRRATAQLALAASAPALPSDRRPTQRESRRAPAVPAPRRNSRSQVALDVPNSGSRTPKRPRPAASSRPRTDRPAPAAAARPRSDQPGLRGVPLGSLAACVSDRLEDSLKQKVVASVRDRTHCESPTGRYHFVETKNVNAFLMGIERAKQRKPGDRCAELTHALACLSPRKR